VEEEEEKDKEDEDEKLNSVSNVLKRRRYRYLLRQAHALADDRGHVIVDIVVTHRSPCAVYVYFQTTAV
jgi:hypothetical protein